MSLSLTAPTEAKLDVFKIGSFVEWISELKFGNRGTFQQLQPEASKWRATKLISLNQDQRPGSQTTK